MSNKNEIRTIKQQIEIVDSFLKGIKDTNVDHMMNGCMFDITNKDMRDRLYSQDLNKLKESMDKLLKSISLEEQLMEINGITQIIAQENGVYCGIVHIHDLTKEGII